MTEPDRIRKAKRAADVGADTPRHRALYRLMLAGVDVDEALQFAELAEGRARQGELAGPLLDACAVAYARVFAEAPVLGPLPEAYASHADPKASWLHHQLLALRDKSVSHGALAKHPVVVHLYEQAAALELVSSELGPEHVSEIVSLLKSLRKRLAQEVVPLLSELFPDRRAGVHLLLTDAAR